MTYRQDFQCDVEEIEYNFALHLGRLHMATENHCDWGGCIEQFEKIDPGVRQINTFAGSKPDTIYKRSADGWHAFLPRMKASA